MSEYLPSLLFIISGIASIVLASFIARDLNNFKPSDRFIACQQTVLSLGSMSVAFGIMSVFLQKQSISTTDLYKFYKVLGASLLIGLLICCSLMFDEVNKIKQFNNKPLRNALFISMIILGVFTAIQLIYLVYIFKNRYTSTDRF